MLPECGRIFVDGETGSVRRDLEQRAPRLQKLD
jgi:hypothetical protein